MSKSKIMKMNRTTTSPNMILLHLKWQQIRSQMLQQIAFPTHLAETRSDTTHKKEFVAA